MGCTDSKPTPEATVADDLANLASMYQRGLLNEQEFAAGKARLLGLAPALPVREEAALHFGSGHSVGVRMVAPAGGAGGVAHHTGCMLSLNCTLIEWVPGPTIDFADYIYQRQTQMTGRLLDSSGAGSHAQIFDIAPHTVSATTGLALASGYCFGRYLQDDKKTVHTFGCVKLVSQVRVSAGKALSAAVMLHYFDKPEHGGMHILHFGNGWPDHFTLVQNNDRIVFQVSPPEDEGSWDGRQEVQSTQPVQAGQTYLIVAVLLPDGRQRLYIDGRLDVEGPGLSAWDKFTGFSSRAREQGWLGRCMRPDTSVGLPAGLLWLQLYDYELTELHQAELLRAAETGGQSVGWASAPPQGLGAFPISPVAPPADFFVNDQGLRGFSNF